MSIGEQQLDILKFGAVTGAVTVGLSFLTPLISGVFPETIRGYFFQTYQNPLGTFINTIIVVWLAFFLTDNVQIIDDIFMLSGPP